MKLQALLVIASKRLLKGAPPWVNTTVEILVIVALVWIAIAKRDL